jgi:Type III secretion protein YscO
MTADDIAALLQIKQAREQRAERALRQAQAAQLRAVRARTRADLATAAFAVERRGQEEAVYRVLSAGPIPGQRLRQAAAQLSGIAAHADMLGQRAAQATRHETACVDTSDAARRMYASASRESLGVASLHGQLAAATRATAEQSHDMELEEAAALRDAAMASRAQR